MKQLACILLFTSILFTATAQHKLVKLWETDTTLKVPESVFIDHKNNVLYVSNIDGQPWAKDGKGSIGKVGMDGKIIAAEWVTGLQAPKGMGMHKNNLYVADLNEVVVIDITKGAIVDRIVVDGAITLNDISVEENGTVYVSDSRGRKVYSIENKKATVLLDTMQLKGPNGVLKHKGSLYVLDAGSMYRMEKNGSLTKLAEGMEASTDGIENISGGDYIVSTWIGVVYYVNADGSKQVLLDGREQKINSADIGYDAAKRIVYIPTFWRNTVAAYELQ